MKNQKKIEYKFARKDADEKMSKSRVPLREHGSVSLASLAQADWFILKILSCTRED